MESTADTLSGRKSVVIVIPALNEEASIAAVVTGCLERAPVIVVSDGSTDATAARARDAGARVVELAQNSGVDAALRAGFAAAMDLGFDVVITVDADGQHDPRLVEKVLASLLDDGVDLCHSCRTSSARRPAEWLLRRYTRMTLGLGDVLSGLKGFRLATVFEPNRGVAARATLGTGLPWCAIDAGLRVSEFDYAVRERVDGSPRVGGWLKANYRVLKALARLAGWDLVSFVRAPRRFVRNRFGRRPRRLG